MSDAIDFLTSLPGRSIDLTAIHPTSGKISGKSFSRGNAEDRAACERWIAGATAKGYGVYFNVNGLSVSLGFTMRDGAKVTKAKTADVIMLNAFHVDADVSKDIVNSTAFAAAKSELLRAIHGMNRPPTIIIDSGNGFGLFWMLRKPVKVTPANRDKFTGINIALRDSVPGAADACQNLDRVMRVPFTTNFPNATKIKRGRVEVATDLISDMRDPVLGEVLYSVEDFEAAPVESPPTAPADDEAIDIPDTVSLDRLAPDFLDLIQKGPKKGSRKIGDGSKSAVLFSICRGLVAAGFSDGEIVAVLADPDNKGPAAHIWREERTRDPEEQARKTVRDMKAKGAVAEHSLTTAEEDFAEDYEEAVASAAKADAELREKKKVKWDSLRKDYAYVTQQEVFVSRTQTSQGAPAMYSVRGFDRKFGYVKRELELGRTPLTDYIFSRVPGSGLDFFESFCYMPGKPENFDGNLNLWRRSGVEPKQGDVRWFYDHLDYLFGADSKHVLNWMAWVHRYQGLHPKHALVTHGEIQGTGKSVINNTMRRLLGSSNCTTIDQGALDLDHDGWKVRTKLLMIEEIRPGFGSSNALAKKLHPLISEDTVHVDMKNRNDFDMPNVIAVSGGSNKHDALTMDDSDRRYLIVSTDRDGAILQPKPNAYYRTIYGKDGVGGYLNDPDAMAAIAFDLLRRPLGDYSAQSPAPFTAAKGRMIEAGGSALQKWMLDNPPDTRLVSVNQMVRRIDADAPDIVRKHRGDIRADIEDILRRKFNGRCIARQIRPHGRNGGKMRVWAIGGNASAMAAMNERDLNAIYRADYPAQFKATVSDFVDDADAE
jgi:hypothetical protein